MSKHNERQLLRALAEIDDLREEINKAFIAGWGASAICDGYWDRKTEKEALEEAYKEWCK